MAGCTVSVDKPMARARGQCRKLPRFWLQPRGDVCGFGVASAMAARPCRVGPGVGGRPAWSRVHRASGLRGPRSRAGGEVLVASFTVSVDNADGGEGSEPDAAMFLAATAWGRVRRRRRRRRGRVAWVRGSRAGGLRGAAFTELRGVGVVGAVLVGGEVVVAGCTVSVDKADGEGSVPCHRVCAGCCRAFGCYRPRRDVRGLSGSLGFRANTKYFVGR